LNDDEDEDSVYTADNPLKEDELELEIDDNDDADEDSVDEVDDVLKEDELEAATDSNDDEVSLNQFEVEDLDVHKRKWQTYLAEKEALLSSKFSVEKSPNAVKLGIGV
jgi:hypothetical protein